MGFLIPYFNKLAELASTHHNRLLKLRTPINHLNIFISISWPIYPNFWHISPLEFKYFLHLFKGVDKI
jgi:hypothetical protein